MKSNFVSLLIGSIISAVILFMWGFIYWGSGMIPEPDWGLKGVPAENLESVNAALRELPAGTYTNPWRGQVADDTPEKHNARYIEGPLAVISVDPDGHSPTDPKMFAEGFIQNLLASLAAGLLLGMAVNSLPRYGQRVLFIFMLGVFAATWAQPNHSIWFFRSCGATTWYVIYDVIAWLLAGLVLAAFIKPRKTGTLVA